MGLNKIILLAVAATLSSCTSSRTEMFQGQPVPLEPGQVLVKSRHQHNLEIWLKNQASISGIAAFKSAESCPDVMGHGQ